MEESETFSTLSLVVPLPRLSIKLARHGFAHACLELWDSIGDLELIRSASRAPLRRRGRCCGRLSRVQAQECDAIPQYVSFNRPRTSEVGPGSCKVSGLWTEPKNVIDFKNIDRRVHFFHAANCHRISHADGRCLLLLSLPLETVAHSSRVNIGDS
jgi:hypothetical protein